MRAQDKSQDFVIVINKNQQNNKTILNILFEFQCHI